MNFLQSCFQSSMSLFDRTSDKETEVKGQLNLESKFRVPQFS